MIAKMIRILAVVVIAAALDEKVTGRSERDCEGAEAVDMAVEEMSTSLLQYHFHHLHHQDHRVASSAKRQPEDVQRASLQPLAWQEQTVLNDNHHATTLASTLSTLSRQGSEKVKSGLPLHTYSQQKRIFLTSVSLTCCLLVCFLFLLKRGPHQCPVTLLAFISSGCFGMANFLMAYASNYLKAPNAHVVVTFFFDGLCALSVHTLLIFMRPDYRSQIQAVFSRSGRVVMLLALTGMFTALAKLTGSIAFLLDTRASGPHQALACSNVLLVAPFFYWYSGETLTHVQVIGCAVILGGIMVMSGINNWAKEPASWQAFVWILLTMFLFAAKTITWRLAALEALLPWQPQVLTIFGCMGFLGCCFCGGVLRVDSLKEYIQAPVLLFWPALNSMVSFLGLWCLQLAYQRPDAAIGAITAVVDSNSLWMATINALLLGLVPSSMQSVGMFVILFGCMTVCLKDVVNWSGLHDALVRKPSL
mmetsp:Transcript_63634/g.110902  ORF Transcript_63634/g.110902 Transcript_63634/m.110902 type:complete len:476 (+) Transcript_63634:74-1501(+)